jgi:hypothetical protein
MKKVMAGLVLAASTLLAAPHISLNVGVGVPVGPVGVGVYAAPAPGYVWVAPGWYYIGGRRVWREGYWRAPVGHFRGHERWRR